MPDTPLAGLLTASIKERTAMNQSNGNAYTCAECGGEAIIGHGNEPERVCGRCFRKRPAKAPRFSQEDKLAWAEDLKAVAYRLYDIAAACPHGHAREDTCDHCWLIHHTVGMLEELANREASRVQAEDDERDMSHWDPAVYAILHGSAKQAEAPGADVDTQRLTQS